MRLCGSGLVIATAFSLRLLGRSHAAVAAALAFIAVSPLLLGRVVLLRFDLLAALLLGAALACACRKPGFGTRQPELDLIVRCSG